VSTIWRLFSPGKSKVLSLSSLDEASSSQHPKERCTRFDRCRIPSEREVNRGQSLMSRISSKVRLRKCSLGKHSRNSMFEIFRHLNFLRPDIRFINSRSTLLSIKCSGCGVSGMTFKFSHSPISNLNRLGNGADKADEWSDSMYSNLIRAQIYNT